MPRGRTGLYKVQYQNSTYGLQREYYVEFKFKLIQIQINSNSNSFAFKKESVFNREVFYPSRLPACPHYLPPSHVISRFSLLPPSRYHNKHKKLLMAPMMSLGVGRSFSHRYHTILPAANVHNLRHYLIMVYGKPII